MLSSLRSQCVVVAVTVLTSLGSRAAETPAEARLREALRAAAAQVRALEDERAQWQLADARQKKEIDSLKGQLKAEATGAKATQAQAQCEARLKRCQGERFDEAATSANLAEALTHCEAAAHDAAIAAKAREEQVDGRDRQQTALRLTALSELTRTCEAKNARLHEVAREILARLSTSCPGEPVLGLERVEIENFAQEAEDRLLEARVKQ